MITSITVIVLLAVYVRNYTEHSCRISCVNDFYCQKTEGSLKVTTVILKSSSFVNLIRMKAKIRSATTGGCASRWLLMLLKCTFLHENINICKSWKTYRTKLSIGLL